MSSQYFPTYSANSKSIKIKLYLSNYATKTDLKDLNADTSSFALKTNLADLKTKVDKIDINKINDTDGLQGKNFVEDSYLYFEPEYRYLETSKTKIGDILCWRSTGLSDEKVNPTKDDRSPKLSFKRENIHVSFNDSILAQERVTYTHGSIVNAYVVYSLLNTSISANSDLIAECLFGTVDLSNNKYTGYSVAFGSKPYLHKNSGKNAKNLIIFGVDQRGSSHTENERNNNLVLGKGSVKITNTTNIKAEDKLKTNCMIANKKFVFSVLCNGDDSYLYIDGVKQYKFKTKNNEIKANKLSLGNILNNNSSNSLSRIGSIYYFSTDYQPTTTEKIGKIHKYLMYKNSIV